MTLEFEVFCGGVGLDTPLSNDLSQANHILTNTKSPDLCELTIDIRLRSAQSFAQLNWQLLDDGLAQLCDRLPQSKVVMKLGEINNSSPEEDEEIVIKCLPQAMQHSVRLKIASHEWMGKVLSVAEEIQISHFRWMEAQNLLPQG